MLIYNLKKAEKNTVINIIFSHINFISKYFF